MERKPIDFSQSLEQLIGVDVGDPSDLDNAPTPLVQNILKSWKKPMRHLTDFEIGALIVQHDGYPFLLDLVWPKLESDPLFDGGYFPGDVLSMLIAAKPEIWTDRLDYLARLKELYQLALKRPLDENEAFREALHLPETEASQH